MSLHRASSCLVFAWAVVAALPVVGQEARPAAPKPPSPEEEVIKALDESYPDHPEWLDMLTDILQDAQMGPNYGWFRTAVAQTRFGWEPTRNRLDRDHDGRITRKEFGGSDRDFARLDRDRDGELTQADFDFSGSALTVTPGSMLFMRSDRDGNGKVTPEELDAFFKMLDTGDQGFLSLSDLQDAFMPAPRPAGRPAAPPAGRPASTGGRPTKAMLVRGLFKQEIGSLQPGPKLDESAPDFTLKTNDGKQQITLSKLTGSKPVVLIFGNITCGPFRSHSGNLEKLYERYKDRATFLMVYVREAHPTDGWRMDSNDRVGVTEQQPRNYEERVEVAQKCGNVLNLGFPMVVDTIDDSVGARYSGMPGRLYLIDTEGKVAYKSGRGPYLFKPAELEQSLVLLLQKGAPKGSQAQGSAPKDAQARRDPSAGEGKTARP